MTPPTLHQNEIARPVPSGARAIGGRRFPRLPASAATTFDDQKTTHRRAGAGHFRAMGLTRCDASFPAHQQGRAIPVAVGTVRFLLPLALYPYLAERFGARSFSAFSQFAGFGAGTSLPFAINTYAADNSSKHYVKPLKRHFQNSVSIAPKPSDRGSQRVGPFTQGLRND